MSLFLTGTLLLLCVTAIGAAMVTVFTKNLSVSILAAGLVSLVASILFLILASPDVAMTEAAIGSGLTTFLFFFVASRLRGGEHD